MKRKEAPRNRQRGAAAVEFALVFPVLLLVVLGAIDWGWFFFIDQLVTNCAREGARAGTLLPPKPSSTDGAAETAAERAGNLFLEKVKLIPPGFNSTYVDATAITVDGEDAIQVVVTFPVGSLTGFLSNVMPANARATAVMRWQ
jgi:Flp pilus assembly protein TadG